MAEIEKKLIVTPEVKAFKEAQGSLSVIKVSEMLETPLHDIQMEIASYFEKPNIDTWDCMVLKLARRLGKTYVARKIIVTLMLQPHSKIALISHSSYLSQETFDEILKDLAKIPSIKDKVKSYKKEGVIEIPELNTRMITASANNYDTKMVGRANNYLILDEFFLVPADIQQNIINFLEPTLITYGRTEEGISNGKILIMSTPRGTQLGSIAGLKDLAGQQGKRGHKSFKYTIYDNPFITEKEIEEIRQNTPKDVFAQEYLVEYTKTSVTTFRNFEPEKNVITLDKRFLKDISPHCDFIVATDYATGDGSGAIMILHESRTDTYYVFDEIYVKETITYDFIKMFKDKTEEWCEYFEYPFESVLFFYDASAREAGVTAQQKFGLSMHKARSSGFLSVDYVNQLLQGKGEGQVPNLFITNNCEILIYMVTFCEHKIVGGQITPQFARDKGALNSHFDLCACLVYGTYSFNKTQHNHLIIS